LIGVPALLVNTRPSAPAFGQRERCATRAARTGSLSPDPARALEAMTQAYNFERDLMAKCGEKHMDRVVRAIASGTLRIEGAPAGGVVEYLLILELADYDVRAHLARLGEIELAWILRSLHHIATGLKQLHSAGIAHQDLKPSNVLIFNQDTSKVADLGRASYLGHTAPHDELSWAGDISYAPPELLYGYVHTDWRTKRFGGDLYLLGSMVVFFFTGLSTHVRIDRRKRPLAVSTAMSIVIG
jgi:eukaryotic-like serine/threonine-protein kinase